HVALPISLVKARNPVLVGAAQFPGLPDGVYRPISFYCPLNFGLLFLFLPIHLLVVLSFFFHLAIALPFSPPASAAVLPLFAVLLFQSENDWLTRVTLNGKKPALLLA